LLYFAQLAVVASLRFRGPGDPVVRAYDIPAHFLLDSQSDSGGLSLGIVIGFFDSHLAAAVLSSRTTASVS
jgi:hypothetical protein